MKKIFKILLIILISCVLLNTWVFASSTDIDWDWVNDNLDKENTYYDISALSGSTTFKWKDLKSYFLKITKVVKNSFGTGMSIKAMDYKWDYIYENNSVRTVILTKDISANKYFLNKNNTSYYFWTATWEIIDEWQLVRYICNEEYIKNSKHWCTNNDLWKFSLEVFKYIYTSWDLDLDWVKDEDDKEKSTLAENIKYICTQNDIWNEKYSCSDTDLWKFKQEKKNSFIDTDWDWINDNEDKELNTPIENIIYICTQNDIWNGKYWCIDVDLWAFKQEKKNGFIDTDWDWINDNLDKEPNTLIENIKYVCSEYNISNWKYSCTGDDLWVFKQEKKDNLSNLDEETEEEKDDRINLWPWTNSFNSTNLNIWHKKSKNTATDKNKHLDNIRNPQKDYSVSRWWEKWIYNTLIRIARDWKNIAFMIASIYLFILVLRLIFVWYEEEEITKFRKWIIRISIGLLVMQISYSFVYVLYDKWMDQMVAYDFIKSIINPLIILLETIASFLFLAMAIYSFFRIITSNGEEERLKSWKMTVLYSMAWFIVIKLSKILVNSTYWTINCDQLDDWVFVVAWKNCLNKWKLSWFTDSFVSIINRMNSIIWIVVIVMIIYAWINIVFSFWDEEKLKKSKMSIVYISIWLFLLFANYLILTFFILPESVI